MIHVAVVDDHQVVRTGIKALLSEAAGIRLTADFPDGRDFLEALPALDEIDVVLLDISMPHVGGLEVLKEVVSRGKGPSVIFLTVHSEETFALQAIKAGARGYLTKESSRETLIEAIRSVAHGGVYLSGRLRDLVFSGEGVAVDIRHQEKLSPRELEVFIHICKGMSIKEIGFLMSLSPKTVSTYKTRLMEKLQVTNLSELVKIGLAWDIVKS